MSDWFSLKCPHCGHRVALHASPDATAVEPGTCGAYDGTPTPCPCPGWWDDGRGTVIDRTSPSLFDEETDQQDVVTLPVLPRFEIAPVEPCEPCGYHLPTDHKCKGEAADG